MQNDLRSLTKYVSLKLLISILELVSVDIVQSNLYVEGTLDNAQKPKVVEDTCFSNMGAPTTNRMGLNTW